MHLGAYEAKPAGNRVVPPSTAPTASPSATDTATRSTFTTKRRWRRGLLFSEMSPDGALPETVERPDFPWFVGLQFHPELKSKLVASFIEAAVKQSRLA